ncbi:AAA family ATPase [Massilia sp. CCM 8734]|uniref:AAA family ATPase n=1 Tax=Massilia sp. CCM 8734 TaxID=2609283 RepID=UPI001424649D|nr:AAA family ATPase [Massilia sp. CCM 8734]NIA00916.1 AAA family ATPase [Massilia sp. CCM 8734]
MQIQHVEVGNFRKLQAVRIDFAEETTVFVGANNSGKTAAMVALRRFLVDRGDFSINDFTLTHWLKIDSAGVEWENAKAEDKPEIFDWGGVVPFIDVWLNVPMHELHYVQKLLPSLDWNGESIGVRLRFEPKEASALRQDYLIAKNAAAAVMSQANDALTSEPTTGGDLTSADSVAAAPGVSPFTLWPRSLVDFLSRRMRSSFEVRAYLLDPAKLVIPKNGIAAPQDLPVGSVPVEGDPFRGLIRIDEISAQRGFGFSSLGRSRSDPVVDELDDKGGSRKLSSQLRAYYTQHLDPFDTPEPKDIQALQALHNAQTAFGARLADSFAAALKELDELGYPGVTDPKLTLATNVRPIDSLNHNSAVQYEIPTNLAGAAKAHKLPEESNGLGYQNLVSIVFALMSFRDKWMMVGKASFATSPDDNHVPPLHLVLIEEPEAHLHAQVQQVFIKQAYDVLRKHDKLKGSKDLRTQLVVSTHSSHLAHAADFASLRYFRRLPALSVVGAVPVSSVVNLSEVFGGEGPTERFVKRYLKATHCDLFFADGAILVEGPAERILVPHLIDSREEYAYLRRCYVTWLEIGGSHAHRLRPLIEHLGLNTLIITDIDAKDSATGKNAAPKRATGQETRNETIKTWVPKQDSLDAALDAKADELAINDPSGYSIRVAYQQPLTVTFKSPIAAEALAYTFEDALLYQNIELFKKLPGGGLISDFRTALDSSTDLAQLAQSARSALKDGSKAQFSLDLLLSEEIKELKMPEYIHTGLLWLAIQLKRKEDMVTGKPLEAAE